MSHNDIAIKATELLKNVTLPTNDITLYNNQRVNISRTDLDKINTIVNSLLGYNFDIDTNKDGINDTYSDITLKAISLLEIIKRVDSSYIPNTTSLDNCVTPPEEAIIHNEQRVTVSRTVIETLNAVVNLLIKYDYDSDQDGILDSHSDGINKAISLNEIIKKLHFDLQTGESNLNLQTIEEEVNTKVTPQNKENVLDTKYKYEVTYTHDLPFVGLKSVEHTANFDISMLAEDTISLDKTNLSAENTFSSTYATEQQFGVQNINVKVALEESTNIILDNTTKDNAFRPSSNYVGFKEITIEPTLINKVTAPEIVENFGNVLKAADENALGFKEIELPERQADAVIDFNLDISATENTDPNIIIIDTNNSSYSSNDNKLTFSDNGNILTPVSITINKPGFLTYSLDKSFLTIDAPRTDTVLTLKAQDSLNILKDIIITRPIISSTVVSSKTLAEAINNKQNEIIITPERDTDFLSTCVIKLPNITVSDENKILCINSVISSSVRWTDSAQLPVVCDLTDQENLGANKLQDISNDTCMFYLMDTDKEYFLDFILDNNALYKIELLQKNNSAKQALDTSIVTLNYETLFLEKEQDRFVEGINKPLHFSLARDFALNPEYLDETTNTTIEAACSKIAIAERDFYEDGNVSYWQDGAQLEPQQIADLIQTNYIDGSAYERNVLNTPFYTLSITPLNLQTTSYNIETKKLGDPENGSFTENIFEVEEAGQTAKITYFDTITHNGATYKLTKVLDDNVNYVGTYTGRLIAINGLPVESTYNYTFIVKQSSITYQSLTVKEV